MKFDKLFIISALTLLLNQNHPSKNDMNNNNYYYGINRPGLSNMSTDDQIKDISEIKSLNYNSIRMGITFPIEKTINSALLIKKMGLSILLIINFNRKEFFDDNVNAKSVGNLRVWPLSKIDTYKYRNSLKYIFDNFDNLHIHVDAIEVGNEINWAGFNGDLDSNVFDNSITGDINSVKNKQSFQDGMKNYINILNITKNILRESEINRNSLIISAGMSDIRAANARTIGAEFVDAPSLISYLKKMGMDNLVDSYGIHIYVNSKLSAAPQNKLINHMLSPCNYENKNCIITEFGANFYQKSCEKKLQSQLIGLERANQIISSMENSGKIIGNYYYAWGGDPGYQIGNCISSWPEKYLKLFR